MLYGVLYIVNLYLKIGEAWMMFGYHCLGGDCSWSFYD